MHSSNDSREVEGGKFRTSRVSGIGAWEPLPYLSTWVCRLYFKLWHFVAFCREQWPYTIWLGYTGTPKSGPIQVLWIQSTFCIMGSLRRENLFCCSQLVVIGKRGFRAPPWSFCTLLPAVLCFRCILCMWPCPWLHPTVAVNRDCCRSPLFLSGSILYNMGEETQILPLLHKEAWIPAILLE